VKGWGIFYVVLGLFIIGSGSISLKDSWREYRELDRQWKELKLENERLEKEIEKYQKEVEKILTDTSYREYLIRKELKMLKPGEKVYRVK